MSKVLGVQKLYTRGAAGTGKALERVPFDQAAVAVAPGHSGSSSSCPPGPAFSTCVRPTVDRFPQHP
jgi:hypothetical protein